MLRNTLISLALLAGTASAQQFGINAAGYFSNQGSDVIVFDDRYPEGHQWGLTIVQQGQRVAASGDVRFEPTQGQWQALPRLCRRTVDAEHQTISVELQYPDTMHHETGFNPMLYQDFAFAYRLTVTGREDGVAVSVEIDKPVPARFAGRLGFNLELTPSLLMGRPWLMDQQTGIFAHQPMGPTLQQSSVTEHIGDYYDAALARGPRSRREYLIGDTAIYNPMTADRVIGAPLACGRRFVLNPDRQEGRVSIESLQGDLKLYDGRVNHQNGWFVLRSEFGEGAVGKVAEWIIRPTVVPEWRYEPVVQTSQVGYHPSQAKRAVIETDQRETTIRTARLIRHTAEGTEVVREGKPEEWGPFMRYRYLTYDFSDVTEPGLYQVTYGDEARSVTFRIDSHVWDDSHIWQSEIEYFLPIQMCHMRINDKYRVWHDLCHMDDAKMAPVDFNHIDGYTQGPSTLTRYATGEHIDGLNVGGWHDAGDWDLRIESQSIQTYLLSLQVENLGAYLDETTIDQQRRIVELHQPDGRNDYLQQIEHGALTIVAGWQQLGRLYRGIICPTVRQYVHLGDGAAQTDRVTGTADDRWVFTEQNPSRELQTAAHLAAIARTLRQYNDTLAQHCLCIARTVFEQDTAEADANPWAQGAALHAAVELYLTTREQGYADYVLRRQDYICQHIQRTGWYVGRFDQAIGNKKFGKALRSALPQVVKQYEEYRAMTPYGVPPHHGGYSSGSWEPQYEGFAYCMLSESYPEIFSMDYVSDCVQFFMGMHPGENRSTFVAGVGAEAARISYGGNRADWSYIPGAVIPGTNLIRPDLPELLRFPFIWQQGEFCIDGHNTWFHYIAMSLAKRYRN